MAKIFPHEDVKFGRVLKKLVIKPDLDSEECITFKIPKYDYLEGFYVKRVLSDELLYSSFDKIKFCGRRVTITIINKGQYNNMSEEVQFFSSKLPLLCTPFDKFSLKVYPLELNEKIEVYGIFRYVEDKKRYELIQNIHYLKDIHGVDLRIADGFLYYDKDFTINIPISTK